MSDLMHLDAQDDPALSAEVDRLLARRTRDIRLKGEIKRLFRARVWSQTAKIIRAWMIWVALLDVLTLALNMLMLPSAIVQSMLLPGAIIPPVVIAVVFAWRKPRPSWLEGASLVVGMFLILLSVALVGVSAGGEFYERQLNVMLFVAITAIIIFGVPLAWTVTIAAVALGLYLVFQVQNPAIEHGSAIDGTLFFASGIFATVAAGSFLDQRRRLELDEGELPFLGTHALKLPDPEEWLGSWLRSLAVAEASKWNILPMSAFFFTSGGQAHGRRRAKRISVTGTVYRVMKNTRLAISPANSGCRFLKCAS